MLIPIPDVPRWYAERKPKDVIAISHRGETPTETTACASVQGGEFLVHAASQKPANAALRSGAHVFCSGNINLN